MSAFEIASAILRLLSNPLIATELSSIWGYKTQIKLLQTTVESIQAVLLHAEEKQFEDRRVSVWLKSLQEPFYDAEDLLDEISYVLRRRKHLVFDYNSKLTKEARIFFSHYNQLKFALKVHWKIKQITEELDAVAKNRRDLGMTERQYVDPIIPARRREETQSYVHEEDVIGRDTEKEAIIGMLINSSYDSSTLPVISIVGIGGMGKTTLAQLVFNDKRVDGHFQLKLWVCVSDEEFSEKRLVNLILNKISPSIGNDNKTLDQLQGELRKNIEGKKYLLVLDDVWNEERTKWLDLRRYLVGGSKGSRIIVTTRSRRVSDSMDASFVHELCGLSDKDAWSLFINMSFGCSLKNVQGRQLDEGLIEIGKDIVKKCANVPLAIRVIGSALYGQEKGKWKSFKDKELPMIFDGEEEAQNKIMQILRVSYNHLSSPLKRCFSYCALFPKDYEIKQERLTRIWITNGCVARSSSIDSHIEDICKEYFSILVQRCFFQSCKYNYFFKVHDLMHDLAKEVSKEEIVSIESSDNSLHRQSINKIRHLGIHCLIDQYPGEARRLSTFISYNSIDPVLPLCKFLRVLDLQGVFMKFLPESIGSLMYLRYLNLSENELIEKLPKSIIKLWCLEYLLVDFCLKLKELPKDLKKLVNLKQLSMNRCNSLSCMPHGMGNLTSLYMLDQFFVCQHKNHGQLKDLAQLKNLREGLMIKVRNEAVVNIASRGHDGEVVTCLTRMEYLSNLGIEFSGKYDADEETLKADDNYLAVFEKLQPPTNIEVLLLTGYEGKSVPRWLTGYMDYFPKLVYLSITSFPRFQYLPQISRLRLLKFLELESLDNIEYMEEENNSQDELSQSVVLFPCLESMILNDMPRLKGWWRKEFDSVGIEEEVENNRSYFPRLSSLWIEGCPELTLFPCIISSKVEFTTENLNFLVAMLWKLFPAGLRKLCVRKVKMPSYLINEVEDVFSSIPDSLEYLTFLSCGGLKALPRCLKHLKSLREMKISECVNFGYIEEEVEGLTDEERMMPWEGFKSLETLELYFAPQLVILPMGIQSVISLQSIKISYCQKLKKIPKWMSKLFNLKSLQIVDADEILIERCKEVTGEDWPKIQHIPHVSITQNLW